MLTKLERGKLIIGGAQLGNKADNKYKKFP